MKAKTKLVILIILFVTGIGMFLWGYNIMINYEDYREIWEEARHAAMPQTIIAIVLLVIAYILTYIKTK